MRLDTQVDRNRGGFRHPGSEFSGCSHSPGFGMISGMTTLKTLVIAAFLAMTLSTPASAERHVVRVEDGITVEEEVDSNRALPVLTGTTTMTASAAQIAAWVGAVHTYTDWQHNCEEARVLPQSDGSTLTYNRIAAPWPVSDRDVVLRSTRTNRSDGSIHIEFRSTDDARLEIPRGVVRMPRLFGSYDLKPVEGGGTHVVYTVDSDPGGSLPAWLVRQASKDLPYFTLKSLQELAEAGPPPAH